MGKMMGKSKKDAGAELAAQSLEALIDKTEKRRLMREIVEAKKPVLESERVLNADNPKLIHDIIRHVENCKTSFVTPDDPRLAPLLPRGMEVPYMMPTEVTAPRERYYFLDESGYLRQINCEVRQESKQGLYKQTTKVGEGGNKYDSTMDRMEQASKILTFGFNAYAIADEHVRDDILRNLTSVPKPSLRMISQRVRIPYHPEGNPDLLIEMALEPLHVGQTFTGYAWQSPKIDLEIKVGPPDSEKTLRHSILAREEERLLSIFPLTRQLRSSPTRGFEEIKDALHNPKVRDRFRSLGATEQWGRNPQYAMGLVAA